MHHYRRGAPWWLETTELAKEAGIEQAAPYIGDPWQDAVSVYVSDKNRVVIAEDVLQNKLEIDQKQWGYLGRAEPGRSHSEEPWL